MKPKTKELERWLRKNAATNPFAAYWWARMRAAEDKDAVALEMRSWYQATMKTMREAFRRFVKPVERAVGAIADATWPLRYADDLAEPEEDVFS